MAVFLVLYILFFLSALIQKGKRSEKRAYVFFEISQEKSRQTNFSVLEKCQKQVFHVFQVLFELCN